MDQPFPQFSDAEKRFVLAEAIKASNISVDRLYALLIDSAVFPDWENMLLPHGRNLSQCKLAFDSLRHLPRAPSQIPITQAPSSVFLGSPAAFSSAPNKRQSINVMSGPDPKRRKSGAETPTSSSHTMIAPKPSNGSQMSPMTSSSSPAPNPNQKKRGRPSKADVERKQKEAIERGEVILPSPSAGSPAGAQGQEGARSGSFAPVTIAPAPPTRSPQAVMTPTLVASPQMSFDQGQPSMMSAEVPAKRRKPKPPPKPRTAKPGEGQFSINTLVNQTDQEERPLASATTATAVPITAPVEAENPPSTTVPADIQDPLPESQPKPEARSAN